MDDPSYAIQAAVYAKLAASTDLQALIGNPVRVYDKVVAAPTYPFVRIGDDQMVGNGNGCFDAWDGYVTVHIFSQHTQAPRPEVKAIMREVARAIGDNDSLIAPAGFIVTEVQLEQSRTYFEDKDGVTCHGVMTFLYDVNDGA